MYNIHTHGSNIILIHKTFAILVPFKIKLTQDSLFVPAFHKVCDSKFWNIKYPSSIYSQNIARCNGVFLFLKSPSKVLNASTNVKKNWNKLFKCAFIKLKASWGIIDSIWWKHTPSNIMAFRNGWKVSYFDGNSISRFLMKPDLCLRSMYISVTSVVEFWGQNSTGSRFFAQKSKEFFPNLLELWVQNWNLESNQVYGEDLRSLTPKAKQKWGNN